MPRDPARAICRSPPSRCLPAQGFVPPARSSAIPARPTQGRRRAPRRSPPAPLRQRSRWRSSSVIAPGRTRPWSAHHAITGATRRTDRASSSGTAPPPVPWPWRAQTSPAVRLVIAPTASPRASDPSPVRPDPSRIRAAATTSSPISSSSALRRQEGVGADDELADVDRRPAAPASGPGGGRTRRAPASSGSPSSSSAKSIAAFWSRTR